jgi:signal-transduction protein with cAMP-binding, CBS, and nucleotidyltransferase domain
MSVIALITESQKHRARCTPHTPMLTAAYLMVDLGLNALAVIGEDDELCGIITDHDVMRGLVANKGQLANDNVSNWMTRKVITCNAGEKPDAALRVMGRHKIRHLILMENHKPIGILGIRDLLSKVHADDELAMNVLRDMSVAVR